MPIRSTFPRLAARIRAMPDVVRYACASALTFGALGIRTGLSPFLPQGYPFVLFLGSVVLSSALFQRGPGLFAAALGAVLSSVLFLPPLGSLSIDDPRHLTGMVIYGAVATMTALMIGWMQDALDQLEYEKRHNALLLKEFRHRTRNDLGSLSAMLLLRARGAEVEAAKAALREAAMHAQSLARIHTLLSTAAPQGAEGAVVDTETFIAGVVQDMRTTLTGHGIRPIVLESLSIAATISTERAVALGLVLNECVQNAAKYAFPGDMEGTVVVQFDAVDDVFVLTVADDGIGVLPGVATDSGTGRGMGTRLLRALASQLRGTFARETRPDFPGTRCTLRFPIHAPAPLHTAPH